MLYNTIFEILEYSEILYNFLGQGLSASGVITFFFIALALQFIFFAISYFFRSTSVYKLAKRENINAAYLAFVPCAFYLILGKLQDNTMRSKSKNETWSYVAFIGSLVVVVSAIVLDVAIALPVLKDIYDLVSTPAVITSEYMYESGVSVAFNLLMTLANLAYLLAAIIIYGNVYRAYAPEKSSAYSVVGALVLIFIGTDILYDIFLFTLRNNERKSFRDYVSQRAAARYRNYNGYNNNPYNNNQRNNYNNPYYNGNPYNNGNYNRPPQNEDPFAEFSDNAGKDDPFFGNDRSGNNGGNAGNDQNGNAENASDETDDLFS